MKGWKLLCFVLLIICVTATTIAEPVVRMPYTLITPQYIREGLYTGQAVDGQPQGYGIFETENITGVKWHYIGYWVNGLMQGEGGTYWDDGAAEIGVYDHSYLIDGFAIDPGASAPDTINASAAPATKEVQYIGNRKTQKFHCLDCSSVKNIKEKNRIQFYGREQAISLGYIPCKGCNP